MTEPLVGRGHAPGDGGASVAPESAPATRPGRAIPRPGVDPPRSPWAPGRLRLGLGVALVAALATAWIGFQPRGTPAAVPEPSVATRPERSATTRAARAPSVPSWIPRAIAATCRARSSATPVELVVECTPGRGIVRLRYSRYASVAALRRAYPAGRGGTGAPACARGKDDERAWSTAAEPTITAGRYRCTHAQAHATIVWTDESVHVLATASRDDADLRSLYEWWTTVPGPTAAR